MIFFNYCFYRISSAYKAWDNTGFHIYGIGVVSLCMVGKILAIISVYLSFSDLKLTPTIAGVVSVVVFVLNTFIMNEKKYFQLSERWKNEKYKKLKGWLVFSYIILSVVIFFVSLYI